MQNFNSFNEQASNGNDRARLNQIHAIIKQTKSGDIRKNHELEKLVEEEIRYWEQQDKSRLTDGQRRLHNDWELMHDYIRRESGFKMTIDDCFDS